MLRVLDACALRKGCYSLFCFLWHDHSPLLREHARSEATRLPPETTRRRRGLSPNSSARSGAPQPPPPFQPPPALPPAEPAAPHGCGGCGLFRRSCSSKRTFPAEKGEGPQQSRTLGSSSATRRGRAPPVLPSARGGGSGAWMSCATPTRAVLAEERRGVVRLGAG